MSKYFNDKNIFNINSIDRYSSGFPISEDGHKKILCLDGDWKFLFCKNATLVPKNFFASDFDYSSFDTIKVPSNWQFSGYDTPMYTNIVYPYALASKNLFRIPHIYEKKNPAGIYYNEFELEDFEDNIFIQLGGANSCAEVYINGEFVGYSEDSFDFQEYNITDFVKKGKNKVVICVYRFCTGSYLEDQDMWRLGGLFRSVNLIFKPKTEISDFYFRSELSDNYTNAKFIAEVIIKGEASGSHIEVEIFDDNNLVKKISTEVSAEKSILTADLANITTWSHENPKLYNIVVTLFDKNQKFVDKRIHNFGFREVKITPYENGKGPFIMLNGKPIKFHGVNRHEFFPDCGHAVDEKKIFDDVKLCLENNITAIRTCHYPNSRVFYEICDKLGVLVMCENNLETHGLSFLIPNSSPLWTKHCVYRMRNMVNTYKNHACIVSWSLGNEAGFGKAFVAMKEEALAIDKTRFIHYEEDTSGKVSDVFSEMYANLEKMPSLAQNKNVMHCMGTVYRPLGVFYPSKKYRDLPYIECEYAHCMGNSLGNFADYWEEFRKSDRLSGGFIWDFADQAFKYDNNGVIEYRYGGDFGEKPNAGRFAFNGIVRGDRTPNPALFEVRKVYQQVDFYLNNEELTLNNRFFETNLNIFKLVVSTYFDGVVESVKEYSVPSVVAGDKGTIKIDIPQSEDKEVFVKVALLLLEDKGILKAGHQMAYEGFLVKEMLPKVPELDGVCSFSETDWEISVNGQEFNVNIDKKTGGITSISKDGKEKLKAPILPSFYRALTSNEQLPQVDVPIAQWYMGINRFKKAVKSLRPAFVKATSLENSVLVSIEWKMKCLKKLRTEYLINENGIEFSMKVVGRYSLPRYGFTFEVREQVKKMEFYAKGPHENYCDRATSALLGKFEGEAEDFIHDYWDPQENGNHIEARYLHLGEKNNRVSILAVEKPFEFSVHPYTLKMLDDADHVHELERKDNYTINIDGRQKGVGGDTPAVARLKPQYKIKAGEVHSIKFRMMF